MYPRSVGFRPSPELLSHQQDGSEDPFLAALASHPHARRQSARFPLISHSFLATSHRKEVRVMTGKIKVLLLLALTTGLLLLPQLVAYADPIPCHGC
jgi:hypothetical protein